MANKQKAAIRKIILILSCFGLSSCAGFEKSIGSIGGFFHGNTEVDKRDYDLEDKSDYRKYRAIRTQQIKDEEEKILTSVGARDVAPHPKANQNQSTERRLILKYQKIENTKPVLQKLLKP